MYQYPHHCVVCEQGRTHAFVLVKHKEVCTDCLLVAVNLAANLGLDRTGAVISQHQRKEFGERDALAVISNNGGSTKMVSPISGKQD